MIITCDHHSISCKNISNNALKVLYRLHKSGFEAYLVGGGVRDLLIGKKPKDFDISTNATPEEIRKLFHNCRLIGRRFRLAHIVFRSEIVEVATFRGHHQSTLLNNIFNKKTFINHNGISLYDNIFGSIEEDAQRRDFSINSLYYNIIDFTLRDYTGGLQDLNKGIIRLIGDPETRYREDPVRILRAIRFAAKLNMVISHDTAEPITRLKILLYKVSPVRLFEEILKLLQSGYGKICYYLLCKYQLFTLLFPLVNNYIINYNNNNTERIIINVLENIDVKLLNNQPVNPAFLFATILWYPLLGYTQQYTKKNTLSYFEAFSHAMNYILYKQCCILAIPKKLTHLIRNIWELQLIFSRHNTGLSDKKIYNSQLSDAYNLLNLRKVIEEKLDI